jgi:hypothetical protein
MVRHRLKNRRKTPHYCALGVLLTGFLLAFLLVHLSGTRAISAQTRDQCNSCCENAGYDEYYKEQCKLKCFRNPDHCTGGKGARSTPHETAPAPKAATPPPPAQPRAATPPPPQPRMVAPPPGEPGMASPTPPAQRKAAAFRWPNPLNLVPGREADAAAQILALNGIPPQNPNFPRALATVQGILVEFARANPTGGSLPTARLEQVIKQFR